MTSDIESIHNVILSLMCLAARFFSCSRIVDRHIKFDRIIVINMLGIRIDHCDISIGIMHTLDMFIFAKTFNEIYRRADLHCLSVYYGYGRNGVIIAVEIIPIRHFRNLVITGRKSCNILFVCSCKLSLYITHFPALVELRSDL